MELLNTAALMLPSWQPQAFDAWRADLQGICGRFEPTAMRGDRRVTGLARSMDAGGLGFAQVVNDLDFITRNQSDIRSDDLENLFLIVQLEGACGVEHVGRQHVLGVGDCILVDSTKPVKFHFGGSFSNHLSMHLPRQAMYSDSKVSFEIARKLPSHEPMAIMLRALIAKIVSDQGASHSSAMRDLMLNAARQAFVRDGHDVSIASSESRARRLEMMEVLIDRNLTDADLGAKWLAGKIGVSLRTLQEDFQSVGITCTACIRDKRLRLVREKIEALKDDRSGQTIAELAYAAGFNDVSYFNRSFKELFGCAPSDLLRMQARG